MPNKLDRRVRKTHALLLSALTKLMLEKPFQQISVSELCTLADINRGTFYLHYKDIYDMMDSIENELIDDYEAATSDDIFKKDFAHARDFFLKSYTYLLEHQELVMAIIGPNGDPAFARRMEKNLRDKFEQLYEQAVEASPDRHYFFSYLLAGTIALMNSWILSGKKESCEEMADMTLDFILHGISAFVEL